MAATSCRFPEKVKLDVAYLQRQSLWFDIRILWLTDIKVLFGRQPRFRQ
jgi:lipopolysaccharide/colanic/teichoic acid biosynthesis glycosyltransferase